MPFVCAKDVELRREVPLAEVESVLVAGNEWGRVVANDRDSTLRHLTPTAFSARSQWSLAAVANSRWGLNSSALSPSATSFSGALQSHCGACCYFSEKRQIEARRGSGIPRTHAHLPARMQTFFESVWYYL